MNCQLCKQHMYSYYDGDISAQLKQEIDRHIAQCSSCRFQYDLTRQENLLLRDSSDIPALYPDFNQRVLQTIAQGPIASSEDFRPMSEAKPGRWRRLPVYTKAAVAAVLLALCIYIPGIMSGGQEKIAQKAGQPIPPIPNTVKSTVKTPAAYMNGATGGTTTESELSKEHLQIMNDKPSPAPKDTLPESQSEVAVGNSTNINNTDINNANIINKSNAGTVQWAKQDVGRCDRKFAALGGSSVSTWSVQNMPAQYQLLNTNHTDANQAEYTYQTQDGRDHLTVKIITVPVHTSYVVVGAAGVSNSEPPPGLLAAGAYPATSLSRELQVGNEKIKLIMSGNLSNDELNKIASNIELHKNP